MTKTLYKTGNSLTITISKEMREHLGLTSDKVEVEFVPQGILLKKESAGLSFSEAKEQAFREFHQALTNLAK